MPLYDRDYDPIAMALSHASGNRARRMRDVADVLWRFLKDEGVSWVGFYSINDDESAMDLGPSRDSPACNPIELHGACGKSWRTKRPMIVHDVTNLGPDYVACDPRDLSELVIPMFERDGSCWGVLDLDSRERNAFSEIDLVELRRIMESVGLSWPKPHREPFIY